MPSPMNRRDFARATLAGGAALALGGRPALAADAPTGKPAPGKIGEYKISLAQWSLHKALRAGTLDNLDFPKVTRRDYGIDGVEFVNQFFKDKAGDSGYLAELKKRAAGEGVTCVLIMIDGEGDLSAKDDKVRAKAVADHSKWVDAAAALGCHAIRVNTGNNYGPKDTASVADGCGKLVEYATKSNINIICENHGGPSSDPDSLLALMKAVNSPRFGTLPDFGNFPNKGHVYSIDVYDAIARMMPYAKGVSAKSYDFDAQGKEAHLDFARIMKIVGDAGYTGFVGVEYEGDKLSEPEGIRATKDLLVKLRGSNYAG